MALCLLIEPVARGLLVFLFLRIHCQALGKAGHLDVKATWVTLRIPQNAHIIYSDNGWECNKSYPKRKNKCILRKWHALLVNSGLNHGYTIVDA